MAKFKLGDTIEFAGKLRRSRFPGLIEVNAKINGKFERLMIINDFIAFNKYVLMYHKVINK